MAGVIRRERGEEQEKISLLPIPLDLSVQEPKSGGQTERCQLQEPSTKLERKLIVYPYITFTACVLFDVMRKPSAPCTLAQISGTPWCSKEHTSQTQSVPGVLCALYLCQGLLLHLSLMKVYHPAIMIVAGAFRQCKFYQQLSQNEQLISVLIFFSSQIYIQFQFARHFFKQNYFLCSACIGLSQCSLQLGSTVFPGSSVV